METEIGADHAAISARTAIRRDALSRPVGLAVERGILRTGVSYLDYGCGHGEDVVRLAVEHGVIARGWDPHVRVGDPVNVAPAPGETFDVVGLIYVVNVIEDPGDRMATIRAAWRFVRPGGWMIVAVRPLRDLNPGWARCGDGWRTRAGSFHRLFATDSELDRYVRAAIAGADVGEGATTVARISDVERGDRASAFPLVFLRAAT